MLQTIYKFPIEIKDTQVLTLPKGAKILTFQNQLNIPTIWALIDIEETHTEDRVLKVFGTGRPIICPTDKAFRYIGTIQSSNGAFVWHLFEQELF